MHVVLLNILLSCKVWGDVLMFWQEVVQKWWKQMTAVGCDVGLTSTTFHGSPLNPLLCSAAAAFTTVLKPNLSDSYVENKSNIKGRQWPLFLTFRLSFGINASLEIHKEQSVRRPSTCSQLTQDHARAQISALSKPGSRWCCNNTDKSEHSAARSGRRRRGRHRLGDTRDGTASGRFQDGARQRTSLTAKVFIDEFILTSWRCLRTLTCLGKTKGGEYKYCFYKYHHTSVTFCLTGCKKCAAQHRTVWCSWEVICVVTGCHFTCNLMDWHRWRERYGRPARRKTTLTCNASRVWWNAG